MAGEDGSVEPGDFRGGRACVEMGLHPIELGGIKGGLGLKDAEDIGLAGIVARAFAFVGLAL